MSGLSRELQLAMLLLLAACAFAQTPQPALGGTAWQLVQFRGGDGKVLTPDDREKYTFAFGSDGGFSARIDCNRARGGWKSAEPGRLEIGPLALTRAMCPPESLHDQIVRQLNFIRSYVVKDSHLYLALMADGGTYELEPIAAPR